jgi:uncharacterized protein YqfB (UPF0267 family)
MKRSKREAVRGIVSNILLLAISMVMVLGFFYHGEFYQIGLERLVVIGSIVVFVVLKVISWANSEFRTRGKGRVGNLIFRADVIPAVLYGEVTSTIRPLKKSRLRVGNLVNVRAKVSGRTAGTVEVTDIRRRRLEDLSDKDTSDEGVGAREFREGWLKRYGGAGDQIVRVIRFRPV